MLQAQILQRGYPAAAAKPDTEDKALAPLIFAAALIRLGLRYISDAAIAGS